LSVLSEDKLFTSLNQRFRDVCINPNTGALYVALNGTQYPGTAPNKIIMFAPQANTNNVVNKPTIGQTMNLYPNPAQTEFTIEVANSLIGSDLVVYGYDGKQAATFKIQSTKQQIDISNLPAGSYWTVATSALGTVTRTFTKL
jgi:DNA-binding beta-propeller fold protein YncE